MKCPNYTTKLLLTVSHDSERSQDKWSLVIVANVVTAITKGAVRPPVRDEKRCS